MNAGDEQELVRFRRRLDELKQRGCAILVVGETPHEAHRALCRKMLGGGSDTRRTVFLDTGAGCTTHGTAADVPTPDSTPDDVSTVSFAGQARSASATASSASSTSAESSSAGSTEQAGGPESFRSLGDKLERAMRDAIQDATEPAELRVCLDSLLPLVTEFHERAVFRLLHPTIHDCRHADGMLHAHLPLPLADGLAALFRPQFDAVIELRMHEGFPQQRWHLQEEGIVSEWLWVSHA